MSFERFTTDDGLSNFSVTAVLQDRTGFLWVGTQSGLNRYDGSFHVDRALSVAWVSALREDAAGRLWVGTQEGLYVRNSLTGSITGLELITAESDTVTTAVTALREGRDGVLWVGTAGRGLFTVDPAVENDRGSPNAVAFEGASELAADTVWAVHAHPAEPAIMWAATQRGLFSVDLGSGSVDLEDFDGPGGRLQAGDAIRALYIDRSGVLWVGTQNNGLYEVDPDVGVTRMFVHVDGDGTSLSDDFVRTVAEDDDGRVWVGTNGGGLNLLKRAEGRFVRYTNRPSDPGSLLHDRVSAVVADRTGVLWVGTWGGLAKHNPYGKRFDYYAHDPDDPNTLSHSWITSLAEGPDGEIWVGTHGGGLNRFDPRTGGVSRFELPFGDVISLHTDRDGVVWLGTRENVLYEFDPATGRLLAHALGGDGASDEEDIVVSIYEPAAQSGSLWVGSKMRGLMRFDKATRFVGERFVHDPQDPNSISSNYAWPIHEAAAGDLWVGTAGGGLNRFDHAARTFTRYRYDESDTSSIAGDFIFAIGEDEIGAVWFGTYGGGLSRYDRASDAFTTFTEDDGLPHNEVLSIQRDDAGRIWLGTNGGLGSLETATGAFRTYDVTDGLQASSFHVGASLRSSSGELYFGGRSGLNVFHPDSIRDNSTPPVVALTGFLEFDDYVELDTAITSIRTIRLNHKQNVVGFEFAALDFAEPRRNRYRYILEGQDPDWVETDARSARYSRLQPGSYVFRVQGSNNDRVWSREEARVSVVIAPPPWRTPWAYGLYALLVIGVVYGLDRVRHTRIEARAAEKHAEALEELDRLKSQFFVNISHEFRTPLTLVLGPIEDALNGVHGTLSRPFREQLLMMQRNGNRLLLLINQLLDLSKLESGRMHLLARRGDLVSFLRDIVSAFAARAERQSVTLTLSTDLDAAEIHFDRDKLETVFFNLLSNAFKFTPAHGKIVVSIAADDTGQWYEVAVRDTGRGIAPGDLERVFDRFYQADASLTREHQGTGVGLALVRELVEAHRGGVQVESTPGFGSTFFVRLRTGTSHLEADAIDTGDESGVDAAASALTSLPGTLAADEPDWAVGDDEARPAAGAPTVLIIDDNDDVRAYLKSILGRFYRILEASDGKEGLSIARTEIPDLVVSDIMMPKVDGYELCYSIKVDDRLAHVPVILLTAKAAKDSKILGLRTGADAYVYKPFDADELVALTENLISIRKRLRGQFEQKIRIEPTDVTVESADARFLRQVQGVVEEHMGDTNFGVDWLADEVGLSRRQLSRRLHETASLSPAGFIREIRLRRAAQLLEQRAGSVAEVAYRVGFASPDTFSKNFQQVFGVRPSRYPTD